VFGNIERCDLTLFAQAALEAQEAAELSEGVPAVLRPAGAQSFGADIFHGAIEIMIRIQRMIGLEREGENMAGHLHVIETNDQFAHASSQEPGAVLFQASKVFARPISGGQRLWGFCGQALVTHVGQTQVIGLSQAGSCMERAHLTHPSSFSQAA
jgi:hypothetical protein